jgi:hypothetical protein
MRGEVAGHDRIKVEPANVTTASDLGVRRDQIHDARLARDAGGVDPAILRHALIKRLECAKDPMPEVLRGGAKRIMDLICAINADAARQ